MTVTGDASGVKKANGPHGPFVPLVNSPGPKLARGTGSWLSYRPWTRGRGTILPSICAPWGRSFSSAFRARLPLNPRQVLGAPEPRPRPTLPMALRRAPGARAQPADRARQPPRTPPWRRQGHSRAARRTRPHLPQPGRRGRHLRPHRPSRVRPSLTVEPMRRPQPAAIRPPTPRGISVRPRVCRPWRGSS